MIGYDDYGQKVEESEKYSKEVYILKKENTRLKELNREMAELLKRIDLDVDDLIVGNINMIAWAKRSLEISQVLNKAKAEG